MAVPALSSVHEVSEAEPFWTDEDSASYTAFMRSPAGVKLRVLSGDLMTKAAVDATRMQSRATYQCDWASGIAATFSWLDSHLLLSPAGAQSSTSEESDLGATDPFAHLAP